MRANPFLRRRVPSAVKEAKVYGRVADPVRGLGARGNLNRWDYLVYSNKFIGGKVCSSKASRLGIEVSAFSEAPMGTVDLHPTG